MKFLEISLSCKRLRMSLYRMWLCVEKTEFTFLTVVGKFRYSFMRGRAGTDQGWKIEVLTWLLKKIREALGKNVNFRKPQLFIMVWGPRWLHIEVLMRNPNLRSTNANFESPEGKNTKTLPKKSYSLSCLSCLSCLSYQSCLSCLSCLSGLVWSVCLD